MSRLPAGVPGSAPAWSGRTAVPHLARLAGITAVAALVIGSSSSAAGFTDTARLHADVTSGVDVALLDSEGTVKALAREPGTDMAELSTRALVPGATVEIPFRLANNSPGLAVAPTVRVTARPADGTSADELSYLDVSVVHDLADGREDLPEDDPGTAGDPAELDLSVHPEPLEPREGQGQELGEVYDGGTSATGAYTVLLTLEDAPELRELSGAGWDVSISLEGLSHL